MLSPIHQDPDKFAEISTWCPLPPKLIGNKVCLTAFDPAPEYVDTVLGYITDELVATNLGDHLYKALTRKEEEENISYWKCNFNDEYSFFVWSIEHKKLIGTSCLFDLHPINRTAQISIVIGDENYRRKGYATDTFKILQSYAFTTLNVNSIRLEVFEYNEPALECYRKLGFVETGRIRQARWAQGRYWDVILMDILKDEWLQICENCD